MPSLRRTASSPAVRSSPYPYASSSSNATSRTSSNGGHPNRRSLGSETTSRQVLADIEWWKVAEGQHDLAADNESDDRSPDNQDHVLESVFLGSSAADYLFSTILDLGSPEWISTPALARTSPEVLRSGFAALSIAPRTPPRRHSCESSFSSLESSPEPETSTPSPLEGLRSGVLDLDLPFALPEAVRSRRRERESTNRAVTLPAVLTRSRTFADCFSLHDEHPSHYADFAVSPLSSAPDFLN